MGQTERLYKIERLLRTRKFVPIRDFLAAPDARGVLWPESTRIMDPQRRQIRYRFQHAVNMQGR